MTNEIEVAVDRKNWPKARSFFERGPQEKGGEPAGLVTPLGWGGPSGELYNASAEEVKEL